MGDRDRAVFFRQNAIKARSLDELVGLCKGVIADGQVCRSEANFLLNWLDANKAVAREFPASVLYPRLIDMLADGILDDAESAELLDMLRLMTGEQGTQATVTMSTGIAFDTPLPDLSFHGCEFCLTGEFAYGRRKDVEERINTLGGACVKSVVKRGCVVVVGCMGSEAWLHSTHGRKIKEAVAARDKGHPVRVVPEEHWHKCAAMVESAEDRAAFEEAELRTQAQHAIRDIIFGR